MTVDGETHPLPEPFVVLATENPIEYEGTYPLPEAQLDRFLLRVRLGYLEDGGGGRDAAAAAGGTGGRRRRRSPVIDADTVIAMQRVARAGAARGLGPALHRVAGARHPEPREGRRGQPPRRAAVIPLRPRPGGARVPRLRDAGGVKAVAVPALAHRISLASRALGLRVTSADVVEGSVSGVAPLTMDLDPIRRLVPTENAGAGDGGRAGRGAAPWRPRTAGLLRRGGTARAARGGARRSAPLPSGAEVSVGLSTTRAWRGTRRVELVLTCGPTVAAGPGRAGGAALGPS